MEEKAALKRMLERERKARKESEKILEEKSLELYNANQELKKSNSSLENRYQKIIEQAHDIIYRGDENGYCIFVNSIATRILGFSKEELLGKHFTQLITENQKKDTFQFYTKQWNEKIEHTYFEFTVKTKEGSLKWLGQNVSLIIEEGEIIGTSAVARDITDQKQTEELVKRNEEKYRGIIDNMELGLLEVDQDGITISANSRLTDITGYSEKDLIGKNPALLLTDTASKVLIDRKNHERRKGKSSVYEVKATKKNGETLWLMISGAPRFSKEGDFVGSIGIHMDITQQKLLLNELEEAKSLAEESSKAKETFLAHMSHEIRTPLNSVLGMTHLLADTNPTEEQQDYLETIKYSSEILLNIISDILDISKIEAGELEFNATAFDLTEIIKAQQKTFAFRMQEKAVDVILDLDPSINTQIIGDKMFINQILMNLLGNASKFTQKGYIKLIVKKEKETDSQLLIQLDIEDTGIGIDQEHLEQIFDSFKQAEQNTGLKYGGTGLGLSIAKHLVELHGGLISVESTLGVGTCFRLTIPFNKTNIPLTITKPETKRSVEKRLIGIKILVAEDNLMNQKFLSKVLEKCEINYVMCDDGELALEKAKEEIFDLVLMDIQMPKMNGYETTKAIRKLTNENKNVPIIALTASALVDERKKVLEVGMNEHLSKPFSPDQLRKAVEGLLLKPDTESQNFDLDQSYFDEFYGEDNEFKAEMLHLFLKNVDDEMAQLKSAVDSKEHIKVYQVAHKNKSSFLMAGIGELEPILKQIETLASKEDSSYTQLANDLFNKIPTAINSVKEELNH